MGPGWLDGAAFEPPLYNERVIIRFGAVIRNAKPTRKNAPPLRIQTGALHPI
jgi:hypothetical protein